jgi:Tol biopolymer transport system component/DNA-binding winged helix-turn-helix (wHTH) protein
MTERGPPGSRIRFGGFEADLQSKELFKEGKRISLPNQSFIALATLLERPGQLVSREELRRRVWPENRVVEFDQGLNAIINRLREALGTAAPGAANLIETLPRRGYRFTGRVLDEHRQRARRRKVLYGVAGVLGVIAAVGAAVLLTRGGSPDASNLKVDPRTSLIGREVAPALAPNGDVLLFAWNGDSGSGGRFDLYSKRLDSERLLRITRDPAVAIHPTWASDGARIAFARQTDRDSGIYLVAPTGGSERLLVTARFLDEPFMQLSWSPDRRRIAYGALAADGWSHVHLIDVADAKARVLDRPEACADAGLPAFSPDGRTLAFLCTRSSAVFEVYVLDLTTGMQHSIASIEGYPQGLVWPPQGDALFVASDAGADSGLWRVTLRGHSSRLLRSEGPLGPGIAAADGHIDFVREHRSFDISRADLAAPGSASQSLIASTHTQLVPEYSPDGAHIAFESTRSGSSEIWLADGDGGNPVKLTSFNGPQTGAPGWCADGRRLAFDSRASGTSAIYILDLPAGRPHPLKTTLQNLSIPVWSSDCRWIIASNGRTTLYRVPASGGSAERFTEKRAYRAVVSGPRVIFNVAADSGVELWSKPVEGGDEAPLVGMAPLRYSDSWTATSRGIYYTGWNGKEPIVSFYDFASRQTHVVRTMQGPLAPLGGLGISVSKDERWLLYTRVQQSDSDIMTVAVGPGWLRQR